MCHGAARTDGHCRTEVAVDQHFSLGKTPRSIRRTAANENGRSATNVVGSPRRVPAEEANRAPRALTTASRKAVGAASSTSRGTAAMMAIPSVVAAGLCWKTKDCCSVTSTFTWVTTRDSGQCARAVRTPAQNVDTCASVIRYGSASVISERALGRTVVMTPLASG